MKNKIFVIVFCGLLLFGLISPPITKILVDNGVIQFEDLANYQDPVQVGEGPLYGVRQGIENVKADIANIYINYLPFYGDIIDSLSKTKSDINKSSNSSLTNWGVELLAKNKAEETHPVETTPSASETTPAVSETTPATSETTPAVTTTQVSTEPPKDEGVVNPDPFIYGGEIRTEFLNSGSRYNGYALYATLENGETVKFLERAIVMDYETCIARADKQIAELNRIADSNPDINFYVYYGTRLQETPDAEICFPDADECRSVVEYFDSSMSENIAVSHFQLNSIEDRLNTYYLSDHHWSADGMLQAYREIIELIQTKAPDIMDAREPVDYFHDEDVRFFGLYSRGFSIDDVWDEMSFYDFNLPWHTQTGGTPISLMMRKFRRGEIEDGYDLYSKLYHLASSYSYPNNDTGRNLLIMGDSFSQCIAETVASHFDNTYVWHVVYDGEMDYAKYVKERNITDVLVVCFDMRLIYDYNDDIHLFRIKTD